MADTNKDINLRIRAKDYSKKTFSELTKSITTLITAQAEQQEQAKKGEASAQNLEKSYLDLEKAVKAVVRQAADVSAYNDQVNALERARTATQQARQAHDEFARSLEGQEKKTRAQQRQLTSLASAYTRAEKAERGAMDRLTALGERIGRYGIAVNNTGAALNGMEKVVKAANESLAKQEAAVEQNEAALKAMAAAEKAAAAGELAAALERQRNALKMAADQAITTANGWRTAAVNAAGLHKSVTPLSDALNQILNPASNANKTLDGMGRTVDALALKFSKIRKPVTDFKQSAAELRQVQQNIASTGALIDSFTQQVTAVRAARQEYVAARAAVTALAAQMRAADGSANTFDKDMAKAQQRLQQASQSFRSTADAARQSQQALRAAGVATNDLATAETRLTETANKSTAAYNTLTAAVNKYGTGSRKAGESLSFLEDQGRKTLSLAQRLRGEMLSLAATYTGLFGAINLAGDAIEAVRIKQQALAAISVAVGKDTNRQAQEWEYVNKVADKFGFSIENLGKRYGKFAAAASKSGRTNQEVRFMFEQLSTIGRAYNLSGDEMGRAMLAVEQMLGKGQIMAEEFKSQFAEVIPGAFESAAQKLNMTVPQFSKAMENGELDTSALIQILRGLGADAKDAAEQAANGVIAAEGRLASARFRFNEQIANSGFLDAYTNLLERVTNLMASDQGKELANTLGQAFTAVADAAEWAADHIGLVKAVIETVMALKFAQFLFGLYQNMKQLRDQALLLNDVLKKSGGFLIDMATKLGTATVATRVLGTAMSFLGKSIPFIGWAIAIGSFIATLYESSETFRNICDKMMDWAVAAGKVIKGALTGNIISFKDALDSINLERNLTMKTEALQGDIAAITKKGQGPYQDATTPDPGTEYDAEKGKKKAFDQWLANEQKKSDAEQLNQTKRSIKKDLKARLALIDTEYAPRLKEAQARAAEDGGKAEKAVLKIIEQQKQTERLAYANDTAGKEVKTAETRAQKIQAIEQQLQAARDRLTTRGDKMDRTVDFETRQQNAVNDALNSYAKLEAAAKKLGGTEGAGFQKTINQLKEQEVALTKQKAQLEELKALQGDMGAITGERDAQLAALQAKFQAGQMDQVDYIQQVNDVYNKTRPAVQNAINAIRQFAEANKAAFSDPQAFNTLMANLDEYQAKLDGTGKELNDYLKMGIQGAAESVGVAFDSIVQSIIDAKNGTAEWSDMFGNLMNSMLTFFAQLLRQIAMAIIQAAILRALMSYFGAGAGGTAANATVAGPPTAAGTMHTGGMVGNKGLGARSMPASVFAGAPRYHTGGMIGLGPDEVPIVAQKGEEMLTRDDPRNRLNGGLKGGGGDAPIRVIAVDDQRAATTEALKTPAGERAVITVLRGNLTEVKKMLKN